jgi:hypothetical protein
MNVIQAVLFSMVILVLLALLVLTLLSTVNRLPGRLERGVEILGKIATAPFHVFSIVVVGGLLFVIFAPLFAIALPFWFLLNIGEIAEDVTAFVNGDTEDPAATGSTEETEDDGPSGWVYWFFDGDISDIFG